ncbi:chloroplast RNA-binding protein 33 [Wolffia australiana]
MAAATSLVGGLVSLGGASRRSSGEKTSGKLLLSSRARAPALSCFVRRWGRRREAGGAAASMDTYYGGDDEVDGGAAETRRAAPPSSGGADAARRLYVGNLPYSLTPSDLAEAFSEAGSVSSVEVVYDRVTDRSRGFAFVTMGSADEALSAIRMLDGTQLGGRTVKVNFPEVPRGGEREVMGPKIREARRSFIDSEHKLYAGNLSWLVNSTDLRAAFSGCEGLLGAKVIYERDTARSRGYGFVSFASDEDAQSALAAMNGVELQGRPLRLNVAISSGTGGTNTSETAASTAGLSP